MLIPGVNDRVEDARAVARFLAPLRSRINLIPFNPGSQTDYPAPGEEDIEAFARLLTDAGVFVCRRNTKGRDLMALRLESPALYPFFHFSAEFVLPKAAVHHDRRL